MLRAVFILIMFWAVTGCEQVTEVDKSVRILVFSSTRNFRHDSIEAGKSALNDICASNQWKADFTDDSEKFTEFNLKRYDAVIFLNTTGDVLNETQQNAFQYYIRSGGAYIGIHAAADTEYDWPWYNLLCGAYFDSHPAIQEATYYVEDKNHPATTLLVDTFQRTEEIYNFKSYDWNDLKILITVDESSYSGGNMGTYHPVCWYHEFEGGRAFYTAWGHSVDSWSEIVFEQHLTGAIKWACGIE